MAKKILGLDLDGVLYNWDTVAYEYAVENMGVRTSADVFWVELNTTTKYSDVFEFNLLEAPIYRKISPLQNSNMAVIDLAKDFVIFYITARPFSARFSTERWLKDYKFPYRENLIFSSDKVLEVRKNKCDYFIDDRVSTIEKLQYITTAILFRNNFNELEGKHLLSISNLKEFRSVIR